MGSDALERLLDVMRRLRDPETGCAWDLEQDFASIAPYTIEEAYEVDDAIRRGDMEDLRSELGDLLLQVVFHAQMAAEAGHFDFEDVAAEIGDKLVRRHPHVFGDAEARSAEGQRRAWEEQKARERGARARRRAGSESGAVDTLFEGIPEALPALSRAAKLLGRAAGAGHAMPATEAAGRLQGAVRALAARAARRDEAAAEAPATPDGAEAADLPVRLGEALLACVALARELGLDAEAALRAAAADFERRIQLERNASRGT